MKKLYFIIPLCIISLVWWSGIVYAKFIWVSAKVWSINSAPIITSYSPTNTQTLIQRNKIKNFSVSFTDTENDTIFYTITPDVGTISLTSGSITGTASGKTLSFWYLAPSTIPSPNNKKITVTLDDGNGNVIIKTFQLYVY